MAISHDAGDGPAEDHYDRRDTWYEPDFTNFVEEIFDYTDRTFRPRDDNYQLSDDMPQIMWGFVNAFHRRVQSLDDQIAKHTRELQGHDRANYGNEITLGQIEQATGKLHQLNDRKDALEKLFNTASNSYAQYTGEQWQLRPRRNQKNVTQDDLNFLKREVRTKDEFLALNLKDRKHVIVALAEDINLRDSKHFSAISDQLNHIVKARPDIVIHHRGIEIENLLLKQWCADNDVPQVIWKPTWIPGKTDGGYRRNEEMLTIEPAGACIFITTPESLHEQATIQGTPEKPKVQQGTKHLVNLIEKSDLRTKTMTNALGASTLAMGATNEIPVELNIVSGLTNRWRQLTQDRLVLSGTENNRQLVKTDAYLQWRDKADTLNDDLNRHLKTATDFSPQSLETMTTIYDQLHSRISTDNDASAYNDRLFSISSLVHEMKQYHEQHDRIFQEVTGRDNYFDTMSAHDYQAKSAWNKFLITQPDEYRHLDKKGAELATKINTITLNEHGYPDDPIEKHAFQSAMTSHGMTEYSTPKDYIHKFNTVQVHDSFTLRSAQEASQNQTQKMAQSQGMSM